MAHKLADAIMNFRKEMTDQGLDVMSDNPDCYLYGHSWIGTRVFGFFKCKRCGKYERNLNE